MVAADRHLRESLASNRNGDLAGFRTRVHTWPGVPEANGPGDAGATELPSVASRSVADLNHLIGDVTVRRRNRFFDEVARAGCRIGAPVPFGVVCRGASEGR
jgi:hypothetical protein